MSTLVLCSSCTRHFRLHEPVCPFCGSALSNMPRAAAVSMPKGASRSLRYAASAALLASSATFSCGGDQPADDPGQATNTAGGDTSDAGESSSGKGAMQEGGVSGTTGSAGTSGESQSSGGGVQAGGEGNSSAGSSAETAGDGGSADEMGTSGSAQTAGDGGSGESASGAGGSGGGAVGTARACPGFDETGNCRTLDDCADMPMQFGLPFYCAMTPQTYSGCGNPTFLLMCPPGGCGDGMVCVQFTDCGDMQCVAECTDEGCNGENHCVDNQCVAKDCELDGAAPCPDDYTCDPQATRYARHCVPPLCDDGGVECDPWRACDPQSAGADANGCVAAACSTDEDCGCGYCVNSRCEPTLGNCYEQQPAMPYGCVWPDEELV